MELFADAVLIVKWAVANKDLLKQLIAKAKEVIAEIEAHKAANPATPAATS